MRIQGIRKYFDKEAYIIETFRCRKEIFKNIIGSNINNVYSEVRLNNNKTRVDLVCEVEDGSLAFVEISIRQNCINDFETHRKQLTDILDIVGKEKYSQIVLMSPDFLNEDIKFVETLIAPYNVKVHFVYIQNELILCLQAHNNISLTDKKKLTNYKHGVGKCIKVASNNVNANNLFVLNLNHEKCGNSIAVTILESLRTEMYWHLPVHRYKDLRKNIIRIGTGTADIILNIYCNTKDSIRIEVNFAQRLDIFCVFKSYLSDMANEIGSSINIAPNSPLIFTEIPILHNMKVPIDRVVSTAIGYMEYITRMYRQIQL